MSFQHSFFRIKNILLCDRPMLELSYSLNLFSLVLSLLLVPSMLRVKIRILAPFLRRNILKLLCDLQPQNVHFSINDHKTISCSCFQRWKMRHVYYSENESRMFTLRPPLS